MSRSFLSPPPPGVPMRDNCWNGNSSCRLDVVQVVRSAVCSWMQWPHRVLKTNPPNPLDLALFLPLSGDVP